MFLPPSCIDTLYDYAPLLGEEGLCKIPGAKLGTEIAIVGSGAAGLIAAHELLKMGLNPVIYEASNRMGGRLYSKPFEQIQEDKKPFAEMGAMRIPESSRIFFHYAKKINLTYNLVFPSTGHVKSVIKFKDKLYLWENFNNPPEPFTTMRNLLGIFVDPLILMIQKEWEQGNLDKVREIWQTYIDQYKHLSLYQALRERSPIHTPEQFRIFGALGIGHGGFNPVFQVSFLEILRIMVNGYMTKNFLISEGTSEFINRLYHLKIKTPLGFRSLADSNCVRLNLPIVLMDYNTETNNPIIIAKDQNKNFHRIEYQGVIFTGSLCAAHLINMTNRTESGVFLMNAKVRESIQNLQFIAASKTYICTETKFWLGTQLPSIIVTDDLTRSTFFLDYPWKHHHC